MIKNKKFILMIMAVSIGLAFILLSGGALRIMNTNWDEGRHLHPDERFLSQVMSSIRPVDSISDYFDTARSSLNPSNHGFGFFVYGTLPVFLVRYVGEWTGQTGYDLNTLVGRQLSAYFDIVTILLVFLVGLILYNQWVGLGGVALYAFAVLPIQQAHFMTVDSFTNTFAMLTVLAAVILLKRPMENPKTKQVDASCEGESERNKSRVWLLDILRFGFFGLALGMATASKINAVSLALLLPLVELVRWINSPAEQREKVLWRSVGFILFAAVVSFISFRVFQPYAFDGPGFFGLKINQGWWGSLQSLRGQATGDVDFPPALQWTRRELFFSVKNLVLWGIGIPFALSAFFGALGLLYKIIKRKEWIHLPLIAWTGVYFAWQGFAWVKAMRYLLLIYPLLAIIGSWFIYQLVTRKSRIKLKKLQLSPAFLRLIGIVFAVFTFLGTAAYAWSFSKIYTRPVTRVAASDWILENIPGPVTFKIETDSGEMSLPARFKSGTQLDPDEILNIPLMLKKDASFQALHLPEVRLYTNDISGIEFSLAITNKSGDFLISEPIQGSVNFLNVENTLAEINFVSAQPVQLKKDEVYVVEIQANFDTGSVSVHGQPKVSLLALDGTAHELMLRQITERISSDQVYMDRVYFVEAGIIKSVQLPFVLDTAQVPKEKILKLTLSTEGNENAKSESVEIKNTFLDYGDGRGKSFEAVFPTPLRIDSPQVLNLSIELIDGDGRISLGSYAPLHESSWDDGLPTSKPGYVAYQPEGGIYQNGLNLELYWPDDASKLERLKDSLGTSDYIFITSNRQWGTISRVPERYPLSTAYYRELMGCPEELDVVTCYNLAEPGMYQGTLGFDLVKTFTSYPTIFGKEFNDQFAEEAFSVYDHPKVLIFKKSENFTAALLNRLDQVDLSKAVFLTPKQAHTYKAPTDGQTSLMLTPDELKVQRDGGTWSDLFDRDSWINRVPILSVIVYYFFVTILGWLVFPIVHSAFKGLGDKGFAFSKLAGLLLFAWIVFILGSKGFLVTRQLLWFVLSGILLIGVCIGIFKRQELIQFIKSHWKQILVIEALGLAAFTFFLIVRFLNPDLWHQWKGGEKPMDFSYFNAVIKSSTFPAYDPWFGGGYINYYYYGQVIVGMPIKALGIVPSVAYNLILPLWYSLLATGTFSMVWNLSRQIRKNAPEKLFGISFWSGIAGMILVCLLGNLGELKVLNEGWMMLGSQGRLLNEMNGLQKIGAFFRGVVEMFKGKTMPIPRGNWYWNPSRAIPGEPITEFPYFTFLYADLHAHLIAMPIVIGSIGWSLSLLEQKVYLKIKNLWKLLEIIAGLFVGSLFIGALKPTNTWDVYTFFVLAACVLVYVIGCQGIGFRIPKTKEWQTRVIACLLGVVILYVSISLMYLPFNQKFLPGFTKIGFWTGDRTPGGSYITHWGLPLFIIFFWFSWETYQWLARTKMSDILIDKKQKQWMIASLIFIGMVFVALLILKVWIALIAMPICVWALCLLLIPKQADGKRFAYFLIGTGFLLTIVVELVYLVGDIGRMNVVFKLYMQAWLLINLAAAAGLGILLKKQLRWTRTKRVILQASLAIFFTIAFLFPVLATADKVTDRMSETAPHTLDGMKYMESSVFHLDGIQMDLSQDYRAILWMQENILGSPIILEGQAFEYSWGNRFTIYTGLPGVVGWNYHQRQQRAVWANNEVWDRVESVNQFYTSTDQSFITNYLEKHDISYIIVGQLERIRYFGEGIEKFETLNGQLWDAVYREGDTVIYKVKKND